MTKRGAETMSVLAQDQIEIERILALIPKRHRGIRFERVLSNFHPQENTRRLELGFAITWANKNNDSSNYLESILAAEADDPRIDAHPITDRDCQVAELVAASIMRWLPTAVGCSFLKEAFEKGGGTMSYTLPDISKPMLLF
jgi:hypothetical protein